ncbi:hypothetical protein [Massilia mucilaginosa]|uniref:hypothetical protein n=1 Tax=Massilia mucilaginosa TaxID=2609282 RepID=UPI00141F8734|nr:hypothetical protein [Massilia mucilaginosa]
MAETTKPDKHLVREYMDRRTHAEHEPPPSADEIRRILGWELIPHNNEPEAEP